MSGPLDQSRLEILARSGDGEASLVLAVAESMGWLPQRHEKLPDQFLRNAANSTKLGKYLLARHLLDYCANFEEAASYLQAAAEEGLACAATDLGRAYVGGVGVTRNLDAAEKWFKLGAELGDATAWTSLGLMSVSDNGQITDSASAEACFERAASSGDINAFSWLATIYLNSGDSERCTHALRLLEQGADLNDFGCLSRLARILRNGDYGLKKNLKRAEELEKRAQALIGRAPPAL